MMAAAPSGAATRVACAQVALAVGDVDGNRAVLADAVRRAAAAGARVVVLPELANSGYVFTGRDEAIALAESVDGATVSQWRDLAAEADLVIVGGLCESGAAGAVYTSAVVVDGTGPIAVYRKAHLWDREKLVFTAGDARPPVVEVNGVRIGVAVCYDVEFPEWVRLVALAGADLICIPVAWPVYPRPAGERPMEVVRVQAAAAANRVFIAVCDRVGTERGQDWVGASVIVDPDGWPLALAPAEDEQDVAIADCDLALARDKSISERNDVHADRRLDLYRLQACAS
jgi:predicted amidohydrolase